MKIKLTAIVKNSTNINKKGCIFESPYHNNDSCYLKRYTYFNNWFSKQFWTSRTWDSIEPDVFICMTWNLYVNSYQIQKKNQLHCWFLRILIFFPPLQSMLILDFIDPLDFAFFNLYITVTIHAIYLSIFPDNVFHIFCLSATTCQVLFQSVKCLMTTI